jgi:putative membrane protein
MNPKQRQRVITVIHSELTAIVIILLCAAIMARGGWV